MYKLTDPKYYCAHCGCVDTSSKAWINNVTDEIEDYITDRYEEDDNFCNGCQQHTCLLTIEELWDMLSEIPVNADDEIEKDFLSFPTGTDKMDIWHWFDERCPNGLAIDLMGETPKQ